MYYQKVSRHSRIHHISFSQDKKYLFVIDLEGNEILAYRIRQEKNKLELTLVHQYIFSADVKPRHLVCNQQDILYVITEGSCEVYTVQFNAIKGFQVLAKKSILQEGVIKKSIDTGCAIRLTKEQKFLYTTIRGSNVITVFEIGRNTLKQIQNISCYGETPRDICFDKEERYLFCANQDSNAIAIFKKNEQNGTIAWIGNFQTKLPTCIFPE